MMARGQTVYLPVRHPPKPRTRGSARYLYNLKAVYNVFLHYFPSYARSPDHHHSFYYGNT